MSDRNYGYDEARHCLMIMFIWVFGYDVNDLSDGVLELTGFSGLYHLISLI